MRSLIALALGLTLPFAANAQEAVAFKCPSPGVTLTTSTNVTLSFTRQEGLTCFYKTRDNKELGWLGGMMSPATRFAPQIKDEVEKLWPASVGAKSAFIQIEAWGFTYVVRERKTITVPAGTFDVIVLDAIEEGIRNNKHKSTRRFYYAPNLGYHVKFEPILEQGAWGNTPPTPWEAVKITKP